MTWCAAGVLEKVECTLWFQLLRPAFVRGWPPVSPLPLFTTWPAFVTCTAFSLRLRVMAVPLNVFFRDEPFCSVRAAPAFPPAQPAARQPSVAAARPVFPAPAGGADWGAVVGDGAR